MAAAGAAAAVVGTVVAIRGQQKEARARERAAKANASAKRLQALELLDRTEINLEKLSAEGEVLKGKQKLAFSSRGIDISAGTPLSILEETNSQVLRAIILEKRQADFAARQLRSGADFDTSRIGEISKAQRTQSAATFLSGLGRVAGSVS